jgi:hypothetical protein
MDDNDKINWKGIVITITSIITSVVIALTSWTLLEVISSKEDLAVLKSKLSTPEENPPKWFQNLFYRDQDMRNEQIEKLEKEIAELRLKIK